MFESLKDILRRWRAESQAHRHFRDIHNTRRTWYASGVQMGKNNALSDAGVTEIHESTLDEARDKLAQWYPRATVMHVDEVHHIITYRVS